MDEKLKQFDREEFKQQVENWIKGKSAAELQSYYRYLTIMSLINLSLFHEFKLDNIWQDDTKKHAFAIFHYPLRLNYYGIIDRFDSDQNARYAASASVRAIGMANRFARANAVIHAYAASNAATNSAYAAAFAAFAADDASSAVADAAYIVNDAAYIVDDAARATLGDLNRRLPACSIDLLWRGIVLQEKHFDKDLEPSLQALLPEIEKGIQPLKAIGLTFLHNDLVTLCRYLFELTDKSLSDERLAVYACNIEKISHADFADAQLLQQVLFGRTYPGFVRTLIIGHGGSGKTSLFQLLSQQLVHKYSNATIDFNQQRITDCAKGWGISADESSNPVDMELWDFARQTQYYRLHQSFFHNSCFFILVVDSRHQQSPYDWLEQISLLSQYTPSTIDSSDNEVSANSDEPKPGQIAVMIMVNRYENCPSLLNLSDIRYRFPKLHIVGNQFYEINLHDYLGKRLSKQLVDNHMELEAVLSALCAIQGKVAQKMSQSSFDLQTKIIEKLTDEKTIYLEDNALRELTDLELTDLEVDDFNAWVSRFGLLLKIEHSREAV